MEWRMTSNETSDDEATMLIQFLDIVHRNIMV